MDANESGETTTRLTRSLRKRLASIDTEGNSNSRPDSPIKKLPNPVDGSMSRVLRSRLNSIDASSERTKSPLAKLSVVAEEATVDSPRNLRSRRSTSRPSTPVKIDVPAAKAEACSTPTRRSRRRSTSISIDDEPVLNTSKVTKRRRTKQTNLAVEAIEELEAETEAEAVTGTADKTSNVTPSLTDNGSSSHKPQTAMKKSSNAAERGEALSLSTHSNESVSDFVKSLFFADGKPELNAKVETVNLIEDDEDSNDSLPAAIKTSFTIISSDEEEIAAGGAKHDIPQKRKSPVTKADTEKSEPVPDAYGKPKHNTRTSNISPEPTTDGDDDRNLTNTPRKLSSSIPVAKTELHTSKVAENKMKTPAKIKSIGEAKLGTSTSTTPEKGHASAETSVADIAFELLVVDATSNASDESNSDFKDARDPLEPETNNISFNASGDIEENDTGVSASPGTQLLNDSIVNEEDTNSVASPATEIRILEDSIPNANDEASEAPLIPGNHQLEDSTQNVEKEDAQSSQLLENSIAIVEEGTEPGNQIMDNVVDNALGSDNLSKEADLLEKEPILADADVSTTEQPVTNNINKSGVEPMDVDDIISTQESNTGVDEAMEVDQIDATEKNASEETPEAAIAEFRQEEPESNAIECLRNSELAASEDNKEDITPSIFAVLTEGGEQQGGETEVNQSLTVEEEIKQEQLSEENEPVSPGARTLDKSNLNGTKTVEFKGDIDESMKRPYPKTPVSQRSNKSYIEIVDSSIGEKRNDESSVSDQSDHVLNGSNNVEAEKSEHQSPGQTVARFGTTNVHCTAVAGSKIDVIARTSTEPNDTIPETPTALKVNQERRSRQLEKYYYDDDHDECEDELEAEELQNPFIDGQVAVIEDYESGDSMTSEERREILEHEIRAGEESLGSSSDLDNVVDEEESDLSSFIVSDADESAELYNRDSNEDDIEREELGQQSENSSGTSAKFSSSEDEGVEIKRLSASQRSANVGSSSDEEQMSSPKSNKNNTNSSAATDHNNLIVGEIEERTPPKSTSDAKANQRLSNSDQLKRKIDVSISEQKIGGSIVAAVHASSHKALPKIAFNDEDSCTIVFSPQPAARKTENLVDAAAGTTRKAETSNSIEVEENFNVVVMAANSMNSLPSTVSNRSSEDTIFDVQAEKFNIVESDGNRKRKRLSSSFSGISKSKQPTQLSKKMKFNISVQESLADITPCPSPSEPFGYDSHSDEELAAPAPASKVFKAPKTQLVAKNIDQSDVFKRCEDFLESLNMAKLEAKRKLAENRAQQKKPATPVTSLAEHQWDAGELLVSAKKKLKRLQKSHRPSLDEPMRNDKSRPNETKTTKMRASSCSKLSKYRRLLKSGSTADDDFKQKMVRTASGYFTETLASEARNMIMEFIKLPTGIMRVEQYLDGYVESDDGAELTTPQSWRPGKNWKPQRPALDSSKKSKKLKYSGQSA